METSRSIVEEVTDRIAFEIISGAYAPGERLPSVRALADKCGINPSTVQIVVARLRDAGFVQSSHGSGFIVRDIELYGGIDVWGYLFRFAQEMPERATKLLENLLATRRVLTFEVIRAIAKQSGPVDLRPLRRAVERLETLVRSGAGREDFARAELHAARVFMHQADQPVVLAIYNTVGEILLTVPKVLDAMYEDPAFNLAMWKSLVDRWESGTMLEADVETASAALAAFHAHCLERFKRLVAGEVEPQRIGR
jgi:GntR family transcriptional regulator, transcriptional repressor for pyruvate dehydrogenase complex